ncbi:hypothetical protein OROGR_019628 [Orobanche gracilis]
MDLFFGSGSSSSDDEIHVAAAAADSMFKDFDSGCTQGRNFINRDHIEGHN